MDIQKLPEYKERQETKTRLEHLERTISKLRVALAAAETQAAGAEEVVLTMEAQANLGEIPREDAKRARADLSDILAAPHEIKADLRRKEIEADVLEKRLLAAQKRLEAKVTTEMRGHG